jgi:hypothetical protein
MDLENYNKNTKFQTVVLENVESNGIQYLGPFFPEMQNTYWSTADEVCYSVKPKEG